MDGPASTANQDNAVLWPELWSAFANHRSKICEILKSVAQKSSDRLCIWGAGRTADLDLLSLIQYYSKIVLVDLEPSLTEKALQQRGFKNHPQVSVLKGVDLSGIDKSWGEFQIAPSESKLKSIVESSRRFSLEMDSYDIVASTCLLSQITRRATDCLVQSNMPQSIVNEYLPKIVGEIRIRHLQQMLEHTRPGGAAVLISDVTSSEALPEILAADSDLKQIVSKKIVNGNHFHGSNPKQVIENLRGIQDVASLESVKLSEPWIWNSIEMSYLCLAFQIRKRTTLLRG